MNDSRLLLQEFHTLVSEYGERLPMTKMYRESLIRRIEAELAGPKRVVIATLTKEEYEATFGKERHTAAPSDEGSNK
jgi:hypothetical protein